MSDEKRKRRRAARPTQTTPSTLNAPGQAIRRFGDNRYSVVTPRTLVCASERSHEARYSSLTLETGVPVSAEENTRLVQSAYEAFGQGDMAAFAEVMADDIEWVDPGDPDDDPNAGTFKGKEAVLGWFGGLASTLDYTTFEPREFIAQNEKVVSLVYSEATVRDTGRAFVNPEAHVWTIRDGKLARFQSYHDTAAAAAAHRVE
jgi:ketosteroid isomerase-like protein